MTDKELKEIDEYEDFHTHVESEKDNKKRKHRVFIYEDYKSIDGYYVDDGFDSEEIMNRVDFDYYLDEEKGLFKKEKNTGKYYIFTIIKEEKDSRKQWNKIDNIDIDNLTKTKDYRSIISYIDKCYYDSTKD